MNDPEDFIFKENSYCTDCLHYDHWKYSARQTSRCQNGILNNSNLHIFINLKQIAKCKLLKGRTIDKEESWSI